MSTTVRDALHLVSGHLPEGVPHPSLEKGLRNIAAIFGPCCSSYYLEWHMAEPQRTDLLCSVVRADGGRLRKRLAARTSLAHNRQWEPLARFLAAWEHLDDLIPHIWLACDFNGHRERFAPPNIHFCIDRQFINRSRLPGYTNRLSQRQFNRTVALVMQHCTGSLPQPVAASMRRCFKALGTCGEVLHLSFMLNREPPMFKLNLTIPHGRLSGLLQTLQWPGDRANIAALCNEFAPDEQRLKCNICMDANICNRFELELEYNTPLRTDRRRKPMLTSLLRHGLVTRRQVHSLLEWPGRSVASPASANKSMTLERWLDIKICVHGNGIVTAKAYLGFAPLARTARLGW